MHYLAIILQNLNNLEFAEIINKESLEIQRGTHPNDSKEIC